MNVLQPIRETVFRTRHRFRNAWPVWFYVLNQKPRMFWRQQSFAPDTVAQKLIKSLKKNGIAITDTKTLFPKISFDEMRKFAFETLNKPLVEEKIKAHEAMVAMRVKEGLERTGKRKHVKDFIVEPWGSTGNNLLPTLDNPFIRANLDERVLEIVASYLGLAARFRAFSLRLTLTSPNGAQEYFSQRWHRDNEDKRLCKIFIYITNVFAEEDGPFKYVMGSHASGPHRNIFPARPPSSVYPELGEIEKIILPNTIQTCFGKAGTVILADTGGLHKGGFATAQPRYMYTGTFFTDASVSPIHLEYAGDTSDLLPLARFALARK